MKKIIIAIDVMGGDYGVKASIPACVHSIKKNSNLKLLLVGNQEQIHMQLKKFNMIKHEQFSIVHTSEEISMNQSPISAIRNKKNSSMHIAIKLIKEKKAHACVSAGNTGALVAISNFFLKTLPGIERPGIMAVFPTITGKTRILDLGANITWNVEHLFQFAIMGTALIEILDKKMNPKVGLLNIGVEDIKGNDQIKLTSYKLKQSKIINYIGYVEGNSVYTGKVDLIICDGFTGNIVLKTNEGLAKLILIKIKELFYKNFFTKLLGVISMPVWLKIKKKMDPIYYNGAILLGLNGIVIKSHGNACEKAFEFAIKEAIKEVENNVIDLLRNRMINYVNKGLLT
ncbi:phosphate acyltransferase PlsX [Candidatus Legionella polyplacis]|uniref:Phosphate acyltransferase n=1 Tax=Candidatus Legionella polyplacis TaxID=2005262 RepID=A0ABZ2H0I4_9GAMM